MDKKRRGKRSTVISHINIEGLPEEVNRELNAMAARRGITKAQIVREILMNFVAETLSPIKTEVIK